MDVGTLSLFSDGEILRRQSSEFSDFPLLIVQDYPSETLIEN